MTPPPLYEHTPIMKKMHYVYLLQSSRTGLFYLGWTTDVNRRLCEHNNNESTATSNKGPYDLIYYEAYSHKDEAVVREKTLKRCPNVLRQIRKRLFRTLKPASSAFKKVVG